MKKLKYTAPRLVNKKVKLPFLFASLNVDGFDQLLAGCGGSGCGSYCCSCKSTGPPSDTGC